jgi:UDP-glucuronate 4-epimerase
MAKHVLVTGAAGFIGSHVTQALLLRGESVMGLDNLNDYYDPARKCANLEEVRTATRCTSRLTFVKGDVRDRALISRLFARRQIDAVVHLAAMAGVRVSIDDPHLYFDVNLTGTLNLLNAARDHGIANFVFASTSSVYGNTRQVPFIETDTCDRPLAPYPASKRAAEMLGFSYHHLYGQNFTALRFFTVYGPRGRPDMMAYKVLDNIFFGRQVPLYNNGQMHRDWTYVGDIVMGIMAAVDRPLGYRVINLGRGEPVLLADFVRLIEDLAGRRAHLVSRPMMEADIAYTYADVGTAQRLLDYDPRTSVKEGVRRFWLWYQQAVLGREPA